MSSMETSSSTTDRLQNPLLSETIRPHDQPRIAPHLDGSVAEGVRECDSNHDANMDDSQDAVSQTSTLEYGHEPWSTFQEKVRRLAAEVLKASLTNIEVEHLAGGSDNRVAGVIVHPPKPEKWTMSWLNSFVWTCCGKQNGKVPVKYIVRIPRDGPDDMDNDLAILKYVATHLQGIVPVPTVVLFDQTPHNYLGRSYMLQKRLRGRNLNDVWSSLNMEQKKCIGRHIIHLVKEIRKIRYTSCAAISRTNAKKTRLGGEWDMVTLPVPSHTTIRPETEDCISTPAHPQSPHSFVVSQCERWKAWYNKMGYGVDKFWDDFISMADEMEASGHLPSTISHDFHFTHLDLLPRNILVSIDSHTKCSVTGILDWDSALFVPAFMAHRAPFWMWAAEDTSDDDETQALRPENELTDEQKQLRAVFEELAGKEWLDMAYGYEYQVLRKMFTHLRDGCWASWIERSCKKIVKDWNVYKGRDQITHTDCGSDDDTEDDSESDSEDDSEEDGNDGSDDGNGDGR